MDQKLSALSIYYPWKLSSDQMRPNILLMCKMLVLLLVVNGFFAKINDPFIPFILWLDNFNIFPGYFKYSLRILFIIFSVLLFLNIKPKFSSFIIGFIIILTLISSKPLFRNHIFIVGCILFLAGLTKNKGLPWLIILQISLLYFGASLNKALQIDWWTGQFMNNWLEIAVKNPIYIFISDLLPHLLFAKILSWGVIIIEVLISVSLLFNKLRNFGIWLIVLFHFMMFTVIGSSFGHFVQDIFIILIAFLDWPEKKVIIQYKNNGLKKIRNTIKFLDWDKLYFWQKGNSNKIINLEADKLYEFNKNVNPFINLLLYTEGFYIFIFLFDFITINLIHLTHSKSIKILIHFIFCLAIWIIIFSFLPLKYKSKKIVK